MGDRFEIELEADPGHTGGRRRRHRPASAASNAGVGARSPFDPTGPDVLAGSADPLAGDAPVPLLAEPAAEPRRGRHHRTATVVAVAAACGTFGWAAGRVSAPGQPTSQLTAGVPSSTTPATATDAIPGRTSPAAAADRVLPRQLKPITEVSFHGQLLPTRSAIHLVGTTTAGAVVDIEVDSGTVRVTTVPEIGPGDQAFVVATRDATVLSSRLDGTTFVLGAGEPRRLDDAFGGGANAYVADGTATLWAHLDRNSPEARLERVRVDGTFVGPSLSLDGFDPVGSDFAGGVLVETGGGVYVFDESGSRRVTTGRVLGVTTGYLLVSECDEHLVCVTSVVDRLTGLRTTVTIPGLAPGDRLTGYDDTRTMAPDGSAAVVVGIDGRNEPSLIELRTGEVIPLGPLTGQLSVAWSVDGRFVLFLRNRELMVLDRRDASISPLAVDADLPRLYSFTTRP